jgi:hypothetical protein
LFYWLVVSLSKGSELELGFYPALPESNEQSASLIFDIEKQADRTIWHDKEKNFDIGLGKVTDGSRNPIQLKFDEIKDFLSDERHKDLIVVWFDKSVMWNDKPFITKRATEVTKQMKEVGFKRVVILGAAGSGVHYVADTQLKANAELNAAGQPPLSR